jgi:hypothetical protein
MFWGAVALAFSAKPGKSGCKSTPLLSLLARLAQLFIAAQRRAKNIFAQ